LLTVPSQQPILDILAEMIAYDGSLRIGTSYTGGPQGVDVAELMREMGEMGDMGDMGEMGGMGGIPGVGLD
jgi:import receptor subunit TOM20